MEELRWIGQNWPILTYVVASISVTAVCLYQIKVLLDAVFSGHGLLNFRTKEEIVLLENTLKLDYKSAIAVLQMRTKALEDNETVLNKIRPKYIQKADLKEHCEYCQKHCKEMSQASADKIIAEIRLLGSNIQKK